MNRFLPIILLFGILFNCAAVVVFKIKNDRRVASEYQNLSNALHSQVESFSLSALRSIDSYFISNSVYRSSSVTNFLSGSTSPKSPVYDVVGDWEYIYWKLGSESFARVVNLNNSKDYRVGDRFPRGGIITSIEPDGICLNDFFWVNNRISSSGVKSPSTLARSNTDNLTSKNINSNFLQ